MATTIKGGEWIIKEVAASDIFIPEDFNEEQLMVRDMCVQFMDGEVLPVIERIDKLEPGLMPSLLEKAGEQGLLGITIPEAYGGSGKDFITSTIVAESLFEKGLCLPSGSNLTIEDKARISNVIHNLFNK